MKVEMTAHEFRCVLGLLEEQDRKSNGPGPLPLNARFCGKLQDRIKETLVAMEEPYPGSDLDA